MPPQGRLVQSLPKALVDTAIEAPVATAVVPAPSQSSMNAPMLPTSPVTAPELDVASVLPGTTRVPGANAPPEEAASVREADVAPTPSELDGAMLDAPVAKAEVANAEVANAEVANDISGAPVYLGVFSSLENASRARAQIVARLPSEWRSASKVVQANVNGRDLYRVVIDGLPNRYRAGLLCTRLRGAGLECFAPL